MAKSQQTFNKKEKEKKRLKKKKEKEEKKAERKANSAGGGLDAMMAYVDADGNIVDTPPDPTIEKEEIDADSIVLGVPKKVDEGPKVNEGKVSFYDGSKGFGFIIDNLTQDKYFVHFSKCLEEIAEGDKVTFDIEKGMKGLDAVNVMKV